jgi:DNA-binding transcriptional regulator/RsmH inhibitor MraZ
MGLLGQHCSGHLERQLDSKGRVSLPVEWRPASGESVYMIKVEVEDIPALRVLSQAAFDRKLADIEGSREATPAQRDRARGILYGASIETKVNSQGKLTIPKAVAEAHGLSLPGPAHLVGRGELFEIFTPENGKAIIAAEEQVRKTDPVISAMLGF